MNNSISWGTRKAKRQAKTRYTILMTGVLSLAYAYMLVSCFLIATR